MVWIETNQKYFGILIDINYLYVNSLNRSITKLIDKRVMSFFISPRNRCRKEIQFLRFIFVSTFLIVIVPAFSQGYNITFKLENCNDTVLYLYQYSGNEEITIDTSKINNKGYFVFTSKDESEKGLYKVTWSNHKRFLDFFIMNSAPFTLNCDCNNILKTLKTESVENQVFYTYLAYLSTKSGLRHQSNSNDTTLAILSEADYNNKDTREYLDNLVKQYPSLLSTKFLYAFIPFDFKNSRGNTIHDNNSDKYLQINKYHYFDNFDFTDNRLIKTPALNFQISKYIDDLTEHIPDSLNAATKRLLRFSAINKEAQKTVAWNLISIFGTEYYRQGFDEAYVYLIRNFMQTGKVAWYYPETKEREIRLADKFETLLTGKTAPDLILPDTLNTARQLSKVNARYTVLLFWASTCSHCRDEMPMIISTYASMHKKQDLEIFAVSTDTSATRWKNYIRRHNLHWINVFGRKVIKGDYFDLYHIQSTPVIFLLDENKRILAKYLTIDQVKELILKRESGETESLF
jgi:peroxiredoxin